MVDLPDVDFIQSTEQVTVQIMNSRCSLSKSFIVSLAAILSFTSSGCNPNSTSEPEPPISRGNPGEQAIEQVVIHLEAKNTIDAFNRAQQAYRLSNPAFVGSLEELDKHLGVGLEPETKHYSYEVHLIDPIYLVQIVAIPKREDLNSFTGIVFMLDADGSSSEGLSCESEQPTQTPPLLPEELVVDCPEGYLQGAVQSEPSIPNRKVLDREARQSEAHNTVGALSRAQQAYLLSNPTFAGSLEELSSEVAPVPETENYSYQVRLIDPSKVVQIIAIAKREDLKNFTGIVSVLNTGGSAAVLCRSGRPIQTPPPPPPIAPDGEPICPEGYQKL